MKRWRKEQVCCLVNITVLVSVTVFFYACGISKKPGAGMPFRYQQFKASVMRHSRPSTTDTATNLFDTDAFVPGDDSLRPFLHLMDSLWSEELVQLKNSDPAEKPGANEKKQAMEVVDHNIASLRLFLQHKDTVATSDCRLKECTVMAEVNKTSQVLYLYIGGVLQDSFKVSTGIRSRETPEMNLRPSGPLFKKYTSRKFPGGNYKGLGNMPYAVFLKGGYAIHGTTQGNFSRLGSRASHGCIRLHPDDAKVFFELVNTVGLENTWVVVN